MFNTTNYNHESKVVAITKEIEKTISPDKVSEMYDAVKEEVTANILRAYAFESNNMHAAAIIIEPRYDTRTKEYALRFTLNGTEHIDRGILPEDVTYSESRMFEKVFDVYKKAVAKSLMRDTIGTVLIPLRKSSSTPPITH